MACKKCGSDWKTPTGKDCSSCPHCCKRQRHEARSQGRWAEVTEVVACKVCNKTFTNIGAAVGKTKCCSAECTAASRKAWRTAYMAEYKRGNRRGTQATKRLPKPSCKRCGAAFKRRHGGHDANLYCSTTCFFGAVREGSQQFKGRCHGLEAALADWAYEWDAQRPEFMNCECCGAQIQRVSSMQRVCSEACRYRLENPLHETCLDCDCLLNADTRHVRRCEPCKKKRRNAYKSKAGKTPRKRCRRYGVPCDTSVTSRAVFERDGYRCQLCMRKCLRRFTVVDDMPLPLSPTIDHIIAISLGVKGHTWDNVQCACWQCNVAKGAQAKGQLRLAGC